MLVRSRDRFVLAGRAILGDESEIVSLAGGGGLWELSLLELCARARSALDWRRQESRRHLQRSKVSESMVNLKRAESEGLVGPY